MKRLCFDTESNYYKPPGSGIGSPEDHREYLRGKDIRFDCAVVYEERTGEYHEFGAQQAVDLVNMLATADELISHSGTRVDLIVLEHACGEDCIAPLWRITHRDLLDMGNRSSLDDLAQKYTPDRVSKWKSDNDARIAQAETLKPDEFIPVKLARARFDAERTFAVFLALSKRLEITP